MGKTLFFVCALLSVAAYLLLGYWIPRTEFYLVLTAVIFPFVSYLFLVKRASEKQLYWLSIGFRAIFLLSIPVLSDDYFRFIWDGRLIGLEQNPFLHLPSFYEQLSLYLAELTPELYDGMNSPNYFTIYPPLCQAIFYLSTLFSSHILSSVVVIRLCIIAADLGIIYFGRKLLQHFKLNPKNIFLYALNPLIIIELTGNLHFEAIMLFFMLGSIYLLIQNKWLPAALFFAFSVCTKLLPLMILPLLIPQIGFWKSVRFGAVSAVFIVLFFMPFLNMELVHNFMSSVDLYFQKFEFNASLYYLIRWVGYQTYGYNIIQVAGKVLPVIVLISILLISWFNKTMDWSRIFTNILFAFLVYLICASIVHPWYVSTLVLMSCFSRYRFAIVWSLVAYFSYWAYTNEAYQENFLLIFIEYALVAIFLFWELWDKELRIIELPPIFNLNKESSEGIE